MMTFDGCTLSEVGQCQSHVAELWVLGICRNFLVQQRLANNHTNSVDKLLQFDPPKDRELYGAEESQYPMFWDFIAA